MGEHWKAIGGDATEYGFDANLAFSRGVRERIDIDTVKKMIGGCKSVIKTGEDQDRLHVDYEATLHGGGVIDIDAKGRRFGAGRFWNTKSKGRENIRPGEPDVAIEKWSVMPTKTRTERLRCGCNHAGKTGWTIDTSSNTHLILYTFDPLDTEEVFLFSFPLLREASRRCLDDWYERYKTGKQFTPPKRHRSGWFSEVVLVPVSVVERAVLAVQRGVLAAQE